MANDSALAADPCGERFPETVVNQSRMGMGQDMHFRWLVKRINRLRIFNRVIRNLVSGFGIGDRQQLAQLAHGAGTPMTARRQMLLHGGSICQPGQPAYEISPLNYIEMFHFLPISAYEEKQ